eukprot:XP_011664224.1 PREDICTED: protein diaphanous homolog 2-like [Strongylocentrotus purpuratus]
MERLMEKKKSAEPRVEPTCGLSSHKSLEEENKALRCSIAIIKELPTLLQAVRSSSPSPSPSSRPSASSLSPIPSASHSPIPGASPCPSPIPLKPKCSGGPRAFVTLQRDLNTSSGDSLMSKDEVAVLASSNPRGHG